MENIDQLKSLGFAFPSPAYLFGMIVFSIIGYAFFRYGKKAELPIPKWVGVALMLFPYVVPQTWALYLIGSGLCVGAYLFRK